MKSIKSTGNHSTEQAFAEERRAKIMQLLQVEKRVTVNQLVEECMVSAGTIRNDLKELEQLGRLVRTHGGAIAPLPEIRGETGLPLRQTMHADKKEAIAREAVRLIRDGESLFLDCGTTMLALARELGRSNLEIIAVVNDFRIAEALEENERAQIVFIGGVVRKKFHNTTARIDLDMIKRYMVEKAFLSTGGITAEKGASGYLVQEIEYKRAVMSNAQKKIILADSSKLGANVFAQFAEVSELDALITDAEADQDIVAALEENGVEVIVAPEVHAPVN